MEATMIALPTVMAKAQTSEGSLTLLFLKVSPLPSSSIDTSGQALFDNVLEVCSLEEIFVSDAAKWILHNIEKWIT